MSLSDRQDVQCHSKKHFASVYILFLFLTVYAFVSVKLLIDGILGTLVIFLVLELLICITAMLFGLSVLAAGGTRVSSSKVPK